MPSMNFGEIQINSFFLSEKCQQSSEILALQQSFFGLGKTQNASGFRISRFAYTLFYLQCISSVPFLSSTARGGGKSMHLVCAYSLSRFSLHSKANHFSQVFSIYLR